jgi:ATP-dependent DNA ligase
LSVDGLGKVLMAAVEQHDLEGIVAKRNADPYRRASNGGRCSIPPTHRERGGTS